MELWGIVGCLEGLFSLETFASFKEYSLRGWSHGTELLRKRPIASNLLACLLVVLARKLSKASPAELVQSPKRGAGGMGDPEKTETQKDTASRPMSARA